jgi:hypothetical protein
VSRAPARLAWLAGAALLAGCAVPSSTSPLPDALLARADALAGQGDETGAITGYSEVIGRYPDTPAASHARILRKALGTMQALRADVAARDTELTALRRNLGAREVEAARRDRDVVSRDLELTRLRAEIAARQADVTRLAAEAERLRADLDRLKRIDLRLEQDSGKRR